MPYLTILCMDRPKEAFLKCHYFIDNPVANTDKVTDTITRFLKYYHKEDPLKFMLYISNGSVCTWKQCSNRLYIISNIRQISPVLKSGDIELEFISDENLLKGALSA